MRGKGKSGGSGRGEVPAAGQHLAGERRGRWPAGGGRRIGGDKRLATSPS
jgi:hypothetical protein